MGIGGVSEGCAVTVAGSTFGGARSRYQRECSNIRDGRDRDRVEENPPSSSVKGYWRNRPIDGRMDTCGDAGVEGGSMPARTNAAA